MNDLEQALQAIAACVYDYCGLCYQHNLNTMRLKLASRLKALQLTSYRTYYHYLQQHPEEWSYIIEALTINETYFYRENKQLTIYQQKLLPTLLQTNNTVHIWSAACSTGEEPYSLAMLARDAGIAPSAVQITATDINARVIAHAQQARYLKQSLAFRRIPSAWLDRYFDEHATHYLVKPDIRQQVTFTTRNLQALASLRSAQYDIIFCRNVLIYFDATTIEQIAKQFYRLLKPGGYLCLGHAETISKLQIGFTTIHEHGAFYYKKG